MSEPTFKYDGGRFVYYETFFRKWYKAMFGEEPQGFENNMLVQTVNASDPADLDRRGAGGWTDEWGFRLRYPRSADDWMEVPPKTWRRMLEDGKSAERHFAMNFMANGVPAMKIADQETGGEAVASLKTLTPFEATGFRFTGTTDLDVKFQFVRDPINWLMVAPSNNSNNWQVVGVREGDGDITFTVTPGPHVAVVVCVGKSSMIAEYAELGRGAKFMFPEVRLGMPLQFKIKAVRP